MTDTGITARAVGKAYDRMSSIYDLLYGKVLHDGRVKLIAQLPVREGQSILEIGVGSGLMLPLYPPGARVLGVDLSEGMVARARQRVARLGLDHVELRVVDAEHTGLASAAFDHVVLPYVYSVTPDPELLIRESFRLCKPGGSIWILNHFSGLGHWHTLERLARPFARWIGFRSDFPYTQFVTAQGWDIQSVQPANLMGLSRIIHIRNGGMPDGQG